jgi:hypothetical protein
MIEVGLVAGRIVASSNRKQQTEQKQAERALRKADELIRLL